MLFTVDDKMSVLLFFVLPGIQSLCLSVIGFWESQIPPSFMLRNYWASRESSQSGWKSDDEFTKEKIHWHERRCFSFFFLPPNTHAVEDKYNHAMLSVSVVWFSLFLLHKWQTGIESTVDKAFVLNKKHTPKKPCLRLFIMWNTVRFGINPIQYWGH